VGYQDLKIKKPSIVFRNAERVVFGSARLTKTCARVPLFSPLRTGTPIRVISDDPDFSTKARLHVEVLDLLNNEWDHACDCTIVAKGATNKVFVDIPRLQDRIRDREFPWMRLVMILEGRKVVLHYFGYANYGQRHHRAELYLKRLCGSADLIPNNVSQCTLHELLHNGLKDPVCRSPLPRFSIFRHSSDNQAPTQ
jgi:hypothetical protein